MIESGITVDYGQLALDAEFARMIKYIIRAIVEETEKQMGTGA